MGRLYDTTTTQQTQTGLQTLPGLQAEAEKVGVGKRAKEIIATKGEDPEKIFSGGFISDTFDSLNLLQHGVTGVLKGKGFVEGVKTRQSFSDKDALGDFGLPGTIAGIALDIAVDPLTYIAPATIFKKIPGATKGLKAVGNIVKDSAIGQSLGTKFIYRFGQDPIYKELAERTIKNIGVSNQNLLEIARPLTKLDPIAQKVVGDARKAGNLESLTPDILAKAKPAFDELDRLGKEAVNVGLLNAETYAENVGKYIARLYRTKEIPEEGVKKAIQFFGKKPLRIDLSRFMPRMDAPGIIYQPKRFSESVIKKFKTIEERDKFIKNLEGLEFFKGGGKILKKFEEIPQSVRESMGEILEAGYPTAKGLVQMNEAIEKAKFFGETAVKWGKDVAEEGFEQLPNVRTLGTLAGKYVPKPIFDDIQELIRPYDKTLSKQLMAGFKYGKVILSPPTHARNVISNFILNHFEGLSPARVDIYSEAAKELSTKGKWYQEAQKVGLGLDTFAAKELKDILEIEAKGVLGKIKGGADKIANLYQKEEEFAKLAQYIFQRKKGLISEEAWKIAERATFNYAQVTPFIRKLRENIWGFPFITFTYKVTPQVAKTIATKPTKISNIGKIKNAIENMADLPELQRERASEPDWIRDGFYVKLPMKDKFGRSAYFDLTYILPFGDLMSGQLLERGVERETGLPESQASAALRKTPLFNVMRELYRNQDFYGNKIWKNSDTQEQQLGDLMLHLVRTYAPPLVGEVLPGGIKPSGERRPTIFGRVAEQQREAVEAGRAQPRTIAQEAIRLLGLKVQPIDIGLQEKYGELEKRKAIESLLQDEGAIQKFQKYFIPKDKPSGRRLYR